MVARLQDYGAGVAIAALGSNFWLQWGSGSAAASSATSVTGSGSETRAAAAVTIVGTTVTIIGTIFAINDGVRFISELGIFDAAGAGAPPSGGNMIYYCDFPPIEISLTGQGVKFAITVQY